MADTATENVRQALVRNAEEYERLADRYVAHSETYRNRPTSNGRMANLAEASKYAGLAAEARRLVEAYDA